MMTTGRIIELLSAVAYRNWHWKVGRDGDRLYLQVVFAATDAKTGKRARQQGRKWMLSPHMTKSEVVQTAFKAVMTAVEHEVREEFTYRGRPVFGPHFDVERLWEMCGRQDAEDRRAERAA